MTIEKQDTDTTAEDSVPAGISFHDLDLEPSILQALDKLKFTTPTPIQVQAIPDVLRGEDIIGIAQTGTGKTLAFGLPILQRFIKSKGRGGRSLILLPTRELAVQVDDALQQIGKSFRITTAVLIGGTPMRPQISQLNRNPDIIVATPGRLIDHLQQGNIDLRAVDMLVLDEADRMLDMGFLPQIKQILRAVPEERQTLLFSATMPDQIVNIADRHMKHPVRVEIARAGTAAEKVSQEVFVVPQDEKNDLLAQLVYKYTGTVLVFTRTRSRAKRVARFVQKMDVGAAEIHSDRTQSQRQAALDGFKAGRFRVLIATDIAARGIDVSNIELVVNYDLPDNAEDYVHRIGRTARAGKEGHAISFAAPDQAADVREIEKLIRNDLPISAESLYPFAASSSSNRRARGGGGSGFGGSGSGGSRSGGSGGPRRGSGGPRPGSSSGQAPRNRPSSPAGRRSPSRRPGSR